MRPLKLRVVEPCVMPWHDMAGGDRARFCARCALPVHDLSAMTEAEARGLIAGRGDRLCVRFEHRRDGTVITRPRAGWIRRLARGVGLAVLAAGFWTAVLLVQRPWQALARRLTGSALPVSPPISEAAPRASNPSEEDVTRQLAELEAARHEELATYLSMGLLPPNWDAPDPPRK